MGTTKSSKARYLSLACLGCLLGLLLMGLVRVRAKPVTVETVAGGVGDGYGGDGGPANKAALNHPWGLALDAQDNLFIADLLNQVVRKVDQRGVITTVAGNGKSGYSGDGGPALRADLAAPMDMAFDKAGNLFIADAGNHAIRKVNRRGIISTIAGTGKAGFAGDGGPARVARFNKPSALAFDGQGNLYVADAKNHRVRKIDLQGRVSTVAGNGKPSRINVIDGESAIAAMEADKGDGLLATKAFVEHPQDVAVDGAGNLYIGEIPCVRKVDRRGIISTVVGQGAERVSAAKGEVLPAGIAVDRQDNLYVVDDDARCVYRIDGKGSLRKVAGNAFAPLLLLYPPRRGDASVMPLVMPFGIAVDKRGRIYVSDSHVGHVVRFSFE